MPTQDNRNALDDLRLACEKEFVEAEAAGLVGQGRSEYSEYTVTSGLRISRYAGHVISVELPEYNDDDERLKETSVDWTVEPPKVDIRTRASAYTGWRSNTLKNDDIVGREQVGLYLSKMVTFMPPDGVDWPEIHREADRLVATLGK